MWLWMIERKCTIWFTTVITMVFFYSVVHKHATCGEFHYHWYHEILFQITVWNFLKFSTSAITSFKEVVDLATLCFKSFVICQHLSVNLSMSFMVSLSSLLSKVCSDIYHVHSPQYIMRLGVQGSHKHHIYKSIIVMTI
jgi:hypothetical protein